MKWIIFNNSYICFLFIFLLTANKNYGQNLVLDPSFEDVNKQFLSCLPYQDVANFSAATDLFWDYPTEGTSDLFSMDLPQSCWCHPLSTYQGPSGPPVGYQLPRTGKAMAGILLRTADQPEYREYLQGQLTSPLQVGITYNISLYVSLGDTDDWACNNIGIKFTTKRIYTSPFSIMQTPPDVNYGQGPIDNTSDWVQINYKFTPTVPDLLYFSIGNFFYSKDTQYSVPRNLTNKSQVYYFVDDISIAQDCNLIANAGNTKTIVCGTNSVTLDGSASKGTPPYKYLWSPATGLNDPTLPNPTVTTNTSQTYTLTVTDNLSCTSTSSVDVTVEKYITPALPNIEPLCWGDNPPVLPPNLDGIGGFWTPPTINNTTSGDYTFTPQSSPCAKQPLPLHVTVYDNFNFEVTQNCINNNVFLEVVPLENSFDISSAQLTWKNDTGTVIGTNNKNFNLTDYFKENYNGTQPSMKYSVEVELPNGCKKTQEISLQKTYCTIQKGISPNNDGKNDFFNLEFNFVKKLSIFNRYGLRVYTKNQYTNQWHGQTDSNEELPDGAYYYVIEFNTDQDSETGWIYINREH